MRFGGQFAGVRRARQKRAGHRTGQAENPAAVLHGLAHIVDNDADNRRATACQAPAPARTGRCRKKEPATGGRFSGSLHLLPLYREALQEIERLVQLIVGLRQRLFFLVLIFCRHFLVGFLGIAVREVARQVSLLDRFQRRFDCRYAHLFQLDVRLYALGLDRTARRRVVTRRGQLDRGTVAQRQNSLHRALAERAATRR